MMTPDSDTGISNSSVTTHTALIIITNDANDNNYNMQITHEYSVTVCCARCTQDEFIPKPATPKHLYHSLIDLLGQV